MKLNIEFLGMGVPIVHMDGKKFGKRQEMCEYRVTCGVR